MRKVTRFQESVSKATYHLNYAHAGGLGEEFRIQTAYVPIS